MFTTVQSNFKTVIDMYFKDYLKKSNYKVGKNTKTNKSFYIFENDVLKVVEFLLSPYNSDEKGEYQILLGIAFPFLSQYDDFYKITESQMKKSEAIMCPIFESLGLISEPMLSYWRNIGDSIEPNEEGEIMFNAFIEFGLPWLERLSDPKKALKFLESGNNPRILLQAALSLHIDEKRMARHFIEKDLEEENNSNVDSEVKKIIIERIINFAKNNKIEISIDY
jgi:hypothetical protein